MAKIEKKVPFDPATITVELDPEIEGGVILTRGDTTFTAPLEDLYQLAAGERGDWQEYLLYQIGSRMHADGVDSGSGFSALKACIERATFEMLN